ncbi:Arc family DNA-binding protein [Herbaspirillum sp. CAH-3]|uniref:Arc family DNA-binding protein n=1 Tax=Herbaspirillum sp. CAH-3 TaxID=2605746 RepID=UPI0012ACC26C|nr:Arc family DNA-binding protein [Herbaspirillum sp. CAH-3]MRT30895.1 Arc family DNA-binding protein [Herbaspirillum sp. CAH-3]
MTAMNKTALRLPPDVHDWVKAAAKESDRSMNNQIVAILKEKKAQSEGRKEAAQ